MEDKNVSELVNLSQFHQHFSGSFCAENFRSFFGRTVFIVNVSKLSKWCSCKKTKISAQMLVMKKKPENLHTKKATRQHVGEIDTR